MKWIHIEDNQFDLEPKVIAEAFTFCGWPSHESVKISDQIACGHGYSIKSGNAVELDKLAELLELAGAKIICK